MVAMPSPWKHPKTGVYYFRRAVPRDLWDQLGREFKRSLGTKIPADAKKLYVGELARSDEMIARARSGYELSEMNAQALAGEWLREALDKDEVQRATTTPEVEVEGGEEHTDPYRPHLDALEIAHERGQVEAAVADEVRSLLRVHDLPIPPGSKSYKLLAEKVFWAKVKYYNVLGRRTAGDWSKVEALDTYPSFSPPSAGSDGGRRKRPRTRGDGSVLQDLFDAWVQERQPAEKTRVEFARAIRRFSELHPNLLAESITRKHVRVFKEAVGQLPVSLSGKQRAMGMQELLTELRDSPVDRTLSGASINKHLTALSTVLAWADRNGYFADDASWSNPAAGMGIARKGRLEEKRLAYDRSDLEFIFATPVFVSGDRPQAGGGEAAKWLPLLGLYTGARLEELGQLRVADVKCEGQVWCIDINTFDEGKKLKTESSRRKVPLHSGLMKLGFLEYLKAQDATGHEFLFPDLRPDGLGQRTGNWSKWWSRYMRSHGLTDTRKVFHSFRHTFKTECRAAAIPKDVSDALTGHTPRDTGGRYGDGYPLTVLHDEIQKLTFGGLDLTHLKPST